MNKPHESVMIPFTITATNLNLADTSPQTIITFADDNLIKIPTRLELSREAGTAYTLTAPAYKNQRVENFQQTIDTYSAMFAGGSYLVIEAVDDDGRGRPFFFVPALGFLDSASNQRRLSFPVINGDTFRTGATKFRLRLTVNAASGTGSLLGRLYFDKYSIGGF